MLKYLDLKFLPIFLFKSEKIISNIMKLIDFKLLCTNILLILLDNILIDQIKFNSIKIKIFM